ncbi:hypothetical protein AB0E10_36715 [Streptomyces sp. NPDC048045]|uniref:hypothetical protein n=1 Tax=Streptomyces sp. NPDC048045 TaxID=3154710 RepID=UPI00341528B8
MTTVTAAPPPAPAWARRAAHAIAWCAAPSGLWRLAMASGIALLTAVTWSFAKRNAVTSRRG